MKKHDSQTEQERSHAISTRHCSRPSLRTVLLYFRQQDISQHLLETLEYYRFCFVTLILSSGLPDPVFKNKKNTFSINCSLSQKLH